MSQSCSVRPVKTANRVKLIKIVFKNVLIRPAMELKSDCPLCTVEDIVLPQVWRHSIFLPLGSIPNIVNPLPLRAWRLWTTPTQRNEGALKLPKCRDFKIKFKNRISERCPRLQTEENHVFLEASTSETPGKPSFALARWPLLRKHFTRSLSCLLSLKILLRTLL